jgi:hypothetical protein
MKLRIPVILLALGGIGLAWNTPAQAIGCLSGGLAGAVAGHMVHHGVLGAVGGCIAGHEYHKNQQRAASQYQNQGPYPNQYPPQGNRNTQ